ncbi:MAG: phosphoglucomutase, alpha-D-glucose phosphate-specific, partial [Bacteroidetes bacterium]|nr:phosphoglucomutase, alpha-D-glucose phosphate-specific [Bacteroidota bacterium]
MSAHKLAGKRVPPELLTNIPRLLSSYYTYKPDIENLHNLVSFGTSWHRGSSLKNSFNEDHVLAICQSICELRKFGNITGPLYVGKDTHALSEAAFSTAIEVFAANNIDIMIQTGSGYTPTPVISHAILTYNQNRKSGLADGVVITPSHNPPDDGGFKYNPPTGGPADTETTNIIQNRANEILMQGLKDVKRMPVKRALKADTTHEYDYVAPYVNDLENIIDMKAIASAGLRIGVDPMGGAGVDYW